MFEVRMHGRGGQGVVTGAEMLSIAAFVQGLHAQAFPSFGSERTGAPVVAFCRIDDREIRVREPIVRPDAVLVADPTLLGQVNVFEGLSPDGYVLINSTRSAAELGLAGLVGGLRPDRVRVVPASVLAAAHTGRPLPNAALLGGLAALCGVVSFASVHAAIHQRFTGGVAAANAAAACAVFTLVRAQSEELADA